MKKSGERYAFKRTVKYICESYPSGNQYFYKQEVITYQSWENPSSLMWSAPRPITEKTFKIRQNEGFKVEYHQQTKQPAVVFHL